MESTLLACLLAGLLATVITLTLTECACLVPEVGGPSAYTHRAFGLLPGLFAGWAMWIAELVAVPVFAIACTNCVGWFAAVLKTRVLFVVALTAINVTAINVWSVRAAGRLNDVLTALKLLPLLALAGGGEIYLVVYPELIRENFVPFAPHGFEGFGFAIVLVFRAYAGLDLTTVPAGEVRNPGRTIPRAIREAFRPWRPDSHK